MRVSGCGRGPFSVAPRVRPLASSGLNAGTARSSGPSGTRRRFWEGKSRNCEWGRSGAPKAAADCLAAAASQAEVQALVRKNNKKILHFPRFVFLFTPLPVTTRSPPAKPTFSMTSFDEILQHRNLQPASAQNFLVFWQDPVPAIQIGSSDNKLRALPLRHNRFPQRSSKYLRVFISMLRDG